ncbi:MAG: hypothetical protein GY820_05435 [Gammaproteobacteria bacterium]|nr:hypothetical protein [Gammaproteobacteria bacterium]
MEIQPPPVEVVNVELLVRQLERAQSHLTFLWMAIMNTRVDKATELGLPIEDGMLTNAELAQLGTLDQRTLFLAPSRYFKPKNDSAGRIKWFMDMIEAAMRLATDQGDFEREFRSLETSEGRVKALDSIFSQAVRLNGGSARSLTIREATLLNAHLLYMRAQKQKDRVLRGMNPEDVPPVLMTPPPPERDSRPEKVGKPKTNEGSEALMQSPPTTPKNEEEEEVISQTGEGQNMESAPAHNAEGEDTRSPSHRESRRTSHRSSQSEKSTIVEQKSHDPSTSPDIDDMRRMGICSQPGGSTALFGASKSDSSPIVADAPETPAEGDKPLPRLSNDKQSKKALKNARKRAKRSLKAKQEQDKKDAATGGSGPPSAKAEDDPDHGTTLVVDINLEDEESATSDSGSEEEGEDPQGEDQLEPEPMQ